MDKRTIEDVNVSGQRVLVRCDFNVPLSDSGEITDENRIVAALPTIRYLMAHNARVILCSHLGRPKGTTNAKYSLAPVAKRLGELLGREVVLASDVIGEDATQKVAALKDGDVMMLENVRFCAQEEKNDREFSRSLASLCDIFVNDAFGTAHRAHSSTAGIAEFCKQSVAGYLIEKEVKLLGDALNNPVRPFVAVLGGAKVSDKIGVIENLLNKADCILIGGAMAYTFLAAKGVAIGSSRVEGDKIQLAADLIKMAEQKNVRLLLPSDHICAKEFSENAESTAFVDDIAEGYMGLDIGEQTCKLYAEVLSKAATIFWNGPMGVFEFDRFARGTLSVATAIAANKHAISIIGGGDSAAAIEKMNLKDQITHVSTGGGASLEFIEGKILPGIDCLSQR